MHHLKFLNIYLAAAMCFAAVAGCQSKSSQKIDFAYIGSNYPVEQTWNAKILFSDSGLTRAILVAPYIAKFDNQGVSERRVDSTFRVDFYDEFGKHTSFLTAKRAKVLANQDMEAYDDVLILSDDSTRITTSYMKWTAFDKKIRSDKFVTIKKPTETLSGYGFESDQHIKNYRIFRASGQMQMNGNAAQTP
jgi:LPS export ABC transporter protein LptC